MSRSHRSGLDRPPSAVDPIDARWLLRPLAAVDARARLFCFPQAGNMASRYRPWTTALERVADVYGVELPGHGTRWREPALRRINDSAAAAYAALRPAFTAPFALMGHSMGALIAYEIARRLTARERERLAILLVSGRPAPHLESTRPVTYDLEDAAFVAHLRDLNGTPAAILDDPSVLQAVLPMMRADFEAVQTYAWTTGPPLSCPIVALTGTHDPLVPVTGAAAWHRHTQADFTLRTFAGDHFFPATASAAVLDAVRTDLIRVGSKGLAS